MSLTLYRVIFIDKLGDKWSSALLSVRYPTGKTVWYAPSGTAYLEYGPVLVFDPVTYKPGDNFQLSVVNGSATNEWEVCTY